MSKKANTSTKNWSKLLKKYELLESDESRRQFLDILEPKDRKNLLRLYNLKQKKAKSRKNLKLTPKLDLTKAILSSSKVKGLENLYSTNENAKNLKSFLKSITDYFNLLKLCIYDKIKKKDNITRSWLNQNNSKNLKEKLEKILISQKQETSNTKTNTHFTGPINTILFKSIKSKPNFTKFINNKLTIKILAISAMISLILVVLGGTISKKFGNLHLMIQRQIYSGTEDYTQWANIFIGEQNNFPDQDVDEDGLTNYEEFLLRINPLDPDQNNNGLLDGIDVLSRINPKNNQPIVGNFVSTNILSLRLQSLALKKQKNELEKRVIEESTFTVDVDPAKAGYLSIPKLEYEDILISWNTDVWKNDLKDLLTQQLIHPKESSIPGKPGITHIYSFNALVETKIVANQSFSFDRIAELVPRDEIFIRAYDSKGSLWEWKYLVIGRNLFIPGDTNQFNQDELNQLQLVIPDTQSQGTKMIGLHARLVETKKIIEIEIEIDDNNDL